MTDQLHLTDAPAWGPHGAELLAGHRTVRWRFELLDRRNKVIRELVGEIADFTAEFNLYTTVRGGGSATYQGTAQPDWMSQRIRAYYGIENRGRTMEWCVGTFMVESPERTLTDMSRQEQNLQLYDITYRLERQTSTAGEWVARKGDNIIDRVRYLLNRQSMVNALEDSDKTFASTMVWPAGTTYLRMTNDMLEAAGFFSITADPMGVLRSGPYRAPEYRGVAFEFRDDSAGHPYRPDFTHSRDTYSVPNQVVAIAANDDPDAEALTVTVEDTTSPFGTVARGFRITHVESDVPAADAEALRVVAQKTLAEKQRVASTYDYSHLPLPLALNDVVRLVRTRHGVDALGVVEKFSYSMAAGSLMATKIREVQG